METYWLHSPGGSWRLSEVVNWPGVNLSEQQLVTVLNSLPGCKESDWPPQPGWMLSIKFGNSADVIRSKFTAALREHLSGHLDD